MPSSFIGFPLAAQLFGPVNAGIGLALAMVVENFLTIPLSLALAEADAGEANDGRSRGARLAQAVAQSIRGLKAGKNKLTVVYVGTGRIASDDAKLTIKR